MRRTRPFLPIICLLLASQLYAAGVKPLTKRIAAVLSDPDLSHGFWGIEVVSLPSGRILYAQNSDKLFTPASNTKLFTTAAALALVGPDYKFHTTVETAGTLDKYGRLSGDLVLMGRGDPNLSGRALPYDLRTERNDHPIQVLENLADALVQKGVKYVDGDIVADDSYFAFERYGEGWSQDDLVWGDGAPVSALTINDNVVFVNILPADRPGERAFVSVTPFADYYRIDNRIITTPAGTGRICRAAFPELAGKAWHRGLRSSTNPSHGTGQPLHVQRHQSRAFARWRRHPVPVRTDESASGPGQQ